MLSIYEYASAPQFLRDAWSKKKEKNPAFSLRSWAKRLGFENNAPLSLMLAGKRPIPRKYIPLFVEHLQLSPKEGLYLETLIEMSNARAIEQKEYYLQRLKSLAPQSKIQMVEVENFKFLGDPLHTIILEMTDLKDFRPEAKWIQKALRFKASLDEIETVVERLIGLGLLREGSDGKWTKTHHHITNRVDIADKGSQEYHRNVSKLAADLIADQAVTDREYNGYAFNIKHGEIPKAKKLIRGFIKDFIREIETQPGAGEETYQLNVQFFSVSQRKEPGESK